MPTSRTNVLYTTTFLRRQRRRHVMTSATTTSTTRRRRHRVKKTTRRANRTDKTTSLSAEIALKYIYFNIKRVTKTPCGGAEWLTKKTCFRAEITSFTAQKREN